MMMTKKRIWSTTNDGGGGDDRILSRSFLFFDFVVCMALVLVASSSSAQTPAPLALDEGKEDSSFEPPIFLEKRNSGGEQLDRPHDRISPFQDCFIGGHPESLWNADGSNTNVIGCLLHWDKM